MDSRDVPNYPPLNGNIETDILQSDISEFGGCRVSIWCRREHVKGQVSRLEDFLEFIKKACRLCQTCLMLFYWLSQ